MVSVEDMDKLFEVIRGVFGCIDVVVNSVGMMFYLKIVDGDLEGFDWVICINLCGVFIVFGLVVWYVECGGWIIVLFISVIVWVLFSYGLYIVFKFGVEGLVYVLVNELCG